MEAPPVNFASGNGHQQTLECPHCGTSIVVDRDTVSSRRYNCLVCNREFVSPPSETVSSVLHRTRTAKRGPLKLVAILLGMALIGVAGVFVVPMAIDRFSPSGNESQHRGFVRDTRPVRPQKVASGAFSEKVKPEWKAGITSYLRARERSFRFVRTYDPEPLDTALFCIRYSRDAVWWFDADEFVLTDEDIALLGPIADAVRTARERGDIAVSDPTQRGQNAEEIACETFRQKQSALIAERMRQQPGAAIRVVYETDEGAGRLSESDCVFFVQASGKVAHVVDTGDFRLRKPDEPKKNDDRWKALRVWNEFMQPNR